MKYDASPKMQEVISSMGRTEDITFSPDAKQLAIVAFNENKIYLFDLEVVGVADLQTIKISKCIIISSKYFNSPHGLSFVGTEHFLVASRGADLTLFECPKHTDEVMEISLEPLHIAQGRRLMGRIHCPGSVASYEINKSMHRVFVCNNYINTIVEFELDLRSPIKMKNKGVLIKRDLSTPDGVSVSPDQKWVAVSNHDSGTVKIYRLDSKLNRFTPHCGELTGIAFPHGIQFSDDGTKVFVTDGGSQYLHLYQSDDGNWDKSLSPTYLKVVEDDVFPLARINPMEGGIKGVDITNFDQLLVTSADYQVLNFYSVKHLLDIQVSSVEEYVVSKRLKEDRELPYDQQPV